MHDEAMQVHAAEGMTAGRPVLWVAGTIAGVCVAGTFALWAHYGSTVFFETILAGIAACL